MRTNASTHAYTHAEVCEVIGIPPATLQNWVNRGIIEIDNKNPGKSAKRLYSLIDIEYILFVYKFASMGIAPGVACDYSASITVKALEYNRTGDGDYERMKRLQYLVAVINPSEFSNRNFGFTTIADIGDDSLVKAMTSTDPVIVFPFGYLRMEMLQKLEKLRAEE